MRHTRWVLAIGITLLVAGAAHAQSGGIFVQVSAAAGEPLPGATVVISQETGFVKTTAVLTDARGLAEFPVLRPGGGYAVEVSFPGYNTIRRDELRVRINNDLQVRIQMFEEFGEEVRVTAERDVIDLDRTEVATKFTEAFVSDLPVLSRYYQNVLTMAPGVQDADEDGNPNVHGSRSRDFQAIIGGMSNVDPLTGQWMSQINPSSIEEIEVITAGAGVEFGRAQGGFARIVQKQGSNQHEGLFEIYLRSSTFDGEGADDPSSIQSAEFDTLQTMFQVSGPLVRDRLWYRLSYERRDNETPVNTISGIQVAKEETETRDAMVTWQASPRNKVSLHYLSDPRDATNVGISSLIPSESSQKQERSVDTYSLRWTAPYSPRILVESTVAWQDVNPSEGPNELNVINDCAGNSNQLFLRPAYCRNLSSSLVSGTYFQTKRDNRQRLTVKGQATVYAGRIWGATHQFKMGINVENERYFRDLERTAALSYELVRQDRFGQPLLQPFGQAVARIAVPDMQDVKATGTNLGAYIEDQIKPLPNLTLTFGLRVDREEINSEGRRAFDPSAELQAYEDKIAVCPGGPLFGTCATEAWKTSFTGYEDFTGFDLQARAQICADEPPELIGFCEVLVSQGINKQRQLLLQEQRRAQDIDLKNTNFSPFFSAAWSPGRDGKTALKVAVGRHYNTIPLLVPLQELEPVLTDIEYDVDIDTQQTVRASTISPTVNIKTVDHDLETPYQDELALTFERELWPETSLNLTYIRRNYRDQIQDENVNVITGDFGRCIPITIFNPRWTVTASPGGGVGSQQLLVDPFTNEVYEDTDPGPGDGRIDDCSGVTALEKVAGINLRVQRPDGIPDPYPQNPFWGEIFRVDNLNEIDYEAFVVQFVRRQYRNWELNASYTWSEARGDGEDFFQEIDNDPGLRESSIEGYQSYDQRHVVKLNATTATPWGIRLGTAVTWQSGLPYSILVESLIFDSLPPSTQAFGIASVRARQRYLTGQRNDQRNKSYWNVDLKATKEIRLRRGVNLQLSAELFNALDDDTLIIYNRDSEAGQQLNGRNEAFRRFGRQWQVGAKLAF